MFCPPPRRGECGCRNIEKIEIVRNVQPDITHVGVAYLEDFQIEHHFGYGAVELAEKLRWRLPAPPAARARVIVLDAASEAHELELKYVRSEVAHFRHILGGIGTRDVKRAHAHAVEEAVVLGVVGGQEKNRIFQGHAEALGDRGGRRMAVAKSAFSRSKSHAAAGEAIVEDHGQAHSLRRPR